MGTKQIVFFDIDDTLLDQNKMIPPSTVSAVQQLQAKGIVTAISTGRAPAMFADVCEALNIRSFVSCNGSYVVYEGEVVHKEILDPAMLDQLEAEAKDKGHPMVFSDHHTVWSNVEHNARIDESMMHLNLPIPTCHKKKEAEIYYALLFCDQSEEDYIHQYERFRFLRWHRHTMDVIPHDGSKAKGIQKMLEKLQLTQQDAVAFGDGLNDLEMLKFVGTGVAMGNAIDEAKAAADLVTKDVDEDGILYGLKSIGLLP